MNEITPQQKKLIRWVNIENNKDLGVFKELNSLEDKIDKVEGVANEALKIAEEVSQTDFTGAKGDKPIAGIDYPIPKHGSDYILTEKDKAEIASKIKVPIVEKVVEKTETIIEKPIVTNQIVKEIKTEFDTTEINEKIEELEKKIDELKKMNSSPRFSLGGRVGLQVLGAGSKIGTKTNEINFSTGLTATNTNGRITVTASSSGSGYQAPTSGTVNGSNNVFVFATEPNVLVIDEGRPIRKTRSDGVANWSGTTSITLLTFTPQFDIYSTS